MGRIKSIIVEDSISVNGIDVATKISNIDNTSDANKPVSTAMTTALGLKQNTLVSGTNVKTINGVSLLGSGDITISGGTTNQNEVHVNQESDLPTNLVANTVYYLHIAISRATPFVMANNTEIRAVSKYKTLTLAYTGVGTMFTATNSSFVLRDVRVNCTLGTLFSVTNLLTNTVNINMVTFDGCVSTGTISGGNILFDDVATINAVGGWTFSGTIFNLRLNLCYFRALTTAAGTHVTIPGGTTMVGARFLQTEFEVNTGQTGLNISNTINPTNGGVIKSCKFEGTAVASSRLVGINGNTTGWSVEYGQNYGIAGLQFVDVEIVFTADSSYGNTAGTFIELSTVRGYVMNLASYDQYATVMQAKMSVMITSVEATFQAGVRLVNTSTNLGGLKTAVLPGALGFVDSDYITITPNRIYTAYYVKTLNGGGNIAIRHGLKMRLKIF